MSNVLPFETTDLPQEDEEEIDPFAELEIGTKSSYRGGSDALSVFEENDDPLAAFAEDESPVEETVISFTDEKFPS